MRENKDQKVSEYGYFLRSVSHDIESKTSKNLSIFHTEFKLIIWTDFFERCCHILSESLKVWNTKLNFVSHSSVQSYLGCI